MAEEAEMSDPTPEQAPAPAAAAAPQAPPPVAPAATAAPPAATTAATTSARNRRKSREGVVASASMDRTAVVVVTEQVRHRRYNKTVRRHKRLYVHDQDNELRPGDRVRIAETRPLSKLKRWRLVQIIERAR